MRVMTLKQFLAQAEDQQDPPDPEVYALKVREFLNTIETQCGDDCTAIVTVSPLEPNTLTVKFVVLGEESDHVAEGFRAR